MPEVHISRSMYRGWPSVVTETRLIRAELVPELGGKIVSLLYKPAGKEWLADAGRRELARVPYGSPFTKADMSGWDECFPTIDACAYPDPERDIRLPDHGELWSVPWMWSVSGDRLRMTAEGAFWPYSFSRTLIWLDDGALRLDYEVRNRAAEPLRFLWAAHPQFAVTEPTRIVVPQADGPWLCVYGDRRYEAGRTYRWDPAEGIVVRPETTGEARKFYYAGKAEGWSRLQGERSGAYVVCSVDAAQVPYWGIWIDEGAFNDRTVCALEPGIGYYDRLDRAAEGGTAGKVEPGGTAGWHLDLTFGRR